MAQVNGKAFSFDSNPNSNTARYTGPSNSAVVHDYIDLSRTPLGASQTKVKSTTRRVATVVNADTGESDDIIVRTEYSYPRWATQAQVDAAISDNASLAGHADVEELVWSHNLKADFETA